MEIPAFDLNAPIPGLDDGQEPAPFASRGETEAADQHQDHGQPAPEPVGTASPAALPRQHGADLLRPPPEPYLRGLGRYDLIRNATALLGPGWDLIGWSRDSGLFYVRQDGRAPGRPGPRRSPGPGYSPLRRPGAPRPPGKAEQR
ncbi:hypothetical protein ACFV6D_24995 [Kitasatospora sp. NPDC059812]|uniref:hypothetical protein n=1 Tax=Kitasatospora sp. NPDC059812 TaxID=3346958 RepID=UPI00365A71EF